LEKAGGLSMNVVKIAMLTVVFVYNEMESMMLAMSFEMTVIEYDIIALVLGITKIDQSLCFPYYLSANGRKFGLWVKEGPTLNLV
jgi:hypothetical protein